MPPHPAPYDIALRCCKPNLVLFFIFIFRRRRRLLLLLLFLLSCLNLGALFFFFVMRSVLMNANQDVVRPS
jgi:hypothetical protein